MGRRGNLLGNRTNDVNTRIPAPHPLRFQKRLSQFQPALVAAKPGLPALDCV